MPRINLPVQMLGANGGGIDNISFTAADAANDHEFDNDGNTYLLMRNTSAGAVTATIVSVPDENGRVGDKTITCPATTGLAIYGPFKPSIWNQPGTGRINVDLATSTGVSFAAVRHP